MKKHISTKHAQQNREKGGVDTDKIIHKAIPTLLSVSIRSTPAQPPEYLSGRSTPAMPPLSGRYPPAQPASVSVRSTPALPAESNGSLDVDETEDSYAVNIGETDYASVTQSDELVPKEKALTFNCREKVWFLILII